MNSIPNHILQYNREKLKSILQKKEILILHSRDIMMKGDEEYFHSTDSWFKYFFGDVGAEEMIGIMYIENKELKSMLGIQEKSEIQQKFQGSITKEELLEQAGVNEVLYKEELIKTINKLITKENFKVKYCLNDKVNYFSNYNKLLEQLKNNENTEFENIISKLAKIREVKDEFEIECITKANEIAKEVFNELLKSIKGLKTEQEVFAKLSYEIFRRNSEHAFYPIVASGRNALTLHYSKHNQKLQENDLLLLDFGCEYLGYKSDISRTIPINGKFSQIQKKIYEAVLRVQEFAISQVRDGLKFKDFELRVAQKMGEELVKLEVISQEELDTDIKCVRLYFPHRCSHHLGLDTHDCGAYEEMKKGMVITIEPGLYIEELGIGVRVEDNVVVKVGGCENLSEGIIKEIYEIEE